MLALSPAASRSAAAMSYTPLTPPRSCDRGKRSGSSSVLRTCLRSDPRVYWDSFWDSA